MPASVAAPEHEIPADQLASVLESHYRGLGAMERYEYTAAARAFGDVHARVPGWTIGTINFAIALLNQGGEAAEKAGRGGHSTESRDSVLNIEAARQLLDGVISRHPDQPHAHFSRGIILRSQGRLAEAHRDFAAVAQIDPHDAHTWLEFGATLTDPDQENMPAGRKQARELVAAYTKAIEANPYLVTAMFKLQFAYNLVGDREHQRQFYETYAKLNPERSASATGEVAATVYGEMGRYARIIDPFPQPKTAREVIKSPRFGPMESLNISLSPQDRWAVASDFQGKQAPLGRIRSRFGAGIAASDVNADGLLDLYLTAAIVGPLGLRDALLINRGVGHFEDQTAAYHLPMDRAGTGVAAADFDSDRRIDLYLTGINDNRLFRQTERVFVDRTTEAGVAVAETVSLTARWFDLDQDGDLDLYVVNHASSRDADQIFSERTTYSGKANSVFRNDGRPAPVGARPEDNWAPLASATADLPATQGLSLAFSTEWPSHDVLRAGEGRHTSFAALDIDDDRDFDYVISAEGEPPQVLLNDRAGRFHAAPLEGWPIDVAIVNLLAVDLDKDRRTDLIATTSTDRIIAWRNETTRTGSYVKLAGEMMPANARNWRSATVADLDLDTWNDLVGLPAPDASSSLEWSRNDGIRLENRPLALGPIGPENRSASGFIIADLLGDSLPDLVLCRDGEAPRIARNFGNGNHWLAVDPSGRWRVGYDRMRSNSAGLGTRLTLEGAGLDNPIDIASLDAGTGQSIRPVILGLASALNAPLLRIRWPDGVIQAELNVTADKSLNLVELNRKTGSCPILFTWNGDRFVCLGDFAGAAGLGFLEAPGEYHPPDRDESLAIAPHQLRDVAGVYRLSIVEPMDEVAYLDELRLQVVDTPPGLNVTPDERFAVGADLPSGQPVAWSRQIEPVSAVDQRGRDVLATLQTADRLAVDGFDRIKGRIGYTERHSITLDFGTLIDHLDPSDQPFLCLTGWVEYPYSQTNYAAATSGLIAQPPVLEQKLNDGSWRVINPLMGHPAGLTRRMIVNLQGILLPGSGCVLRITTNMECYWDQAFMAFARADLNDQVRTTCLPVKQAGLRERGYLRETAPDGRQPTLPDYDQVDPAPLARFEGHLTRLGDVTQLLNADDDQLCVMGPGDEVQLEFDGSNLPKLTSGWSRSFVFRSVAYCKDADPFTATSNTVGPLPWRGMRSFPWPEAGGRLTDPTYSAYLKEFQTRPAGAR